jgi:hypothetical protein
MQLAQYCVQWRFSRISNTGMSVRSSELICMTSNVRLIDRRGTVKDVEGIISLVGGIGTESLSQDNRITAKIRIENLLNIGKDHYH